MVARFWFHRARLFSGGASPSPTRHNKRDSKCAIPLLFLRTVEDVGPYKTILKFIVGAIHESPVLVRDMRCFGRPKVAPTSHIKF